MIRVCGVSDEHWHDARLPSMSSTRADEQVAITDERSRARIYRFRAHQRHWGTAAKIATQFGGKAANSDRRGLAFIHSCGPRSFAKQQQAGLRQGRKRELGERAYSTPERADHERLGHGLTPHKGERNDFGQRCRGAASILIHDMRRRAQGTTERSVAKSRDREKKIEGPTLRNYH
ncbi:hypothetical protein SCHPADRAFT_128291 [Schizopora paradoxa]|uniref:Uncharacterized protein n=1 Tax=Schizopora paradoxa TaxID=27342 RepID=A0A0H2SMF7_9AGAM|nr:hypothetical protein SCHPADRAFT_128291 [Schizopora paradoxa]